MSTQRRVLLVDDHEILRHGLALLINQESDLRVVGSARSAAEAHELLRLEPVDLALVDISLDGHASGLRLVREIADRDPPTRVIVLTMHDESLYWDRAMACGAHGFVVKGSATTELLGAMRQVLDGGVYASSAAQQRLLLLSRGCPREASSSPLQNLSIREAEVLRMIGKGLSSAQIAEQLRRSVKTIEAHKANLKTKLGLASGADLLRYAAHLAAHGQDSAFGT
jgi:two-component system, NarL family, response regulator NreC